MAAAWLIGSSIVLLAIGYIFYGRYLSKRLGVDPGRQTPAHTNTDGVDYVPAKAPILFGHHFSSIAGAGPILGPIYAAVFGWIPVLLWIVIGSIFVGGVHDFSSLVASVRHGGKTFGEVIEEHIGHAGKKLFLVFTWTVLVLVIAVFAKAVASVFVKEPATVTASFLFILLAIVFGLSIYRLKTKLGLTSIVGVLLLLGCVALGILFPIQQSFNFWIFMLFCYVFVAAVTPVWILLQPRDYLNSFLLFIILIAGVIGIFVANPTISFPVVTQFKTNLGYLFPILFVTVACGAISGFHSLVSSGTTSKQLNMESDAKPVGYGSMLVEGVLAVVALITAVTILQGDYSHLVTKEGGGPIGIFSAGIGRFVHHLGIPERLGVTFAALAISAFALTTLDTATRLGRFAFQEFFEREERASFLSKNRYVGTLVTVVFSALLAFSGTSEVLWPLFGSANQLLASIILLGVTVWLAELGKSNRFVKYPMYFMFAVTLTALGTLIHKNIVTVNIPLLLLSIILFIVAIILIVQARNSLVRIGKE
ncbi:MAG: carbon starvation protein A [Candidatus Neomarinimicrobiota bacterium]